MAHVRKLVGGMRAAGLVWWSIVLTGLCVYGIHAFGLWASPAAERLLDGWVYQFLVLAGALSLLARAFLVRDERFAWGLIGAAALAWSVGDIYWWRELSRLEEPPFPSISDGFYLAFYPLAYAGLVLLVRSRVHRFHASQWLDGLAASLVVAAAGAALILPPILAATEGSVAAVATTLAYPLGDLLVLMLLAALAGLMGWRPGRAVGLLAAGCAIFALADSLYFYQVARETYEDGDVSDLFWPMGLIIMGLAAWQPRGRSRPGRLEGWGVMLVPGGVAAGALALLVYDHYSSSGPVAFWLAGGALAVSWVRAGLTFRENIALADSHRQAITDALTGLPNRRLFNDRAEQTILRARRQGDRVAVMIIDLDRFKEVNDTLGHQSGDALLQEVARRLRRTLRESDTVARLGGDEFAVLLPSVEHAEAAQLVAAALAKAISEPIGVEGLSLDTEASIGIALFPDHGQDVAELLQRADVAMYTAKADHSSLELYAPERDSYSPERLALMGELRRAIENDELVLLCQPQVDLLSGELAGVEILIRWQHPDRGLLPPGDFIPLAELTTLIKPLTFHVLNRALEQCRRWEREGRTIPVAVNVSARNLLDPDFADAVAACLERAGVPASRLELEITETALMANPARAMEVLERLSAMGVCLSIDDFGAGYSSLNYLKRLPVDVLKIDKSFVLNMATSPADAMIVRSTIDLGRNLGLRVVAEGIEDIAVYDTLRDLGCDVGQGFYIGRPGPVGDFERWLLDWGHQPRHAGDGAPAG
jgi:diguanylate cyclase (GGDEF)-like protein